VHEALANRQWARDIAGALTAAIIVEYLQLWEKVEDVQLQPNTPDCLIWRWTASDEYTSSSAREVWRASAPPKVKLFFWLALHGRPWTAEHRRRHGLQPSADCVLCAQDDESIDHLLASCVYTREVWHRLLSRIDFQHLGPSDDSLLADWWLQAWTLVPNAFRRGFDSFVLLVSWEI
jgi:hypothetical protein